VFKTIRNYLEGSIDDLIRYIEDFVTQYMDIELKVLSMLRSNIAEYDVDGVKVCIYVKERHVPSSSIIGNVMLGSCDIAIIVHESFKSISFRSKKCDVRELAKAFNGGGHPRAAGAPFSTSALHKILRNLGLDVSKYIVNEILRKIEGVDVARLCLEQ